ncbi:hypothetical protein MP228_003739 [Amoeboaphelidium protococcarum]|nr:hypothetical protein MP228_003739 [Amoeboaphelidium protococcarum]
MIFEGKFYETYHGHPYSDLMIIAEKFYDRSIIWLAGDSSLDNKYWILDELRMKPLNGYENLLFDMVPDVSFQLNKGIVDREEGDKWVAINTAVEATTLNERKHKLLPSDKVISSFMKDGDVLIVSIGGNDVALYPTPSTIWSILRSIRYEPADILSGKAPLQHLVNLLGVRVQDYIKRVIGNKKPRKVIVNMIYYPCEVKGKSWANVPLWLLKYDSEPQKLQAIIQYLFNEATQKISLDGIEVVAFPLFSVLDGKSAQDYVQRVEPSIQGGAKMANAFLDIILN